MAEDHHHHDDDGIMPRLTMAEVKGLKPLVLKDGREYFPRLPALKTNALQGKLDPAGLCEGCRTSPYLDRGGHDKNRELAKIIKDAVHRLKPTDKDGQHFVLQWRLYANKDHKRFNNVDGCACGCGGDSLPEI